jgi:hypothetical protein
MRRKKLSRPWVNKFENSETGTEKSETGPVTMARSDQPIQAETSTAIDLEPYRRLVELQKEIAALAEQNERAQQKCEKLREGVASRVLAQTGLGREQRAKQRVKASGILAQLPMGLMISGLMSRIVK